MPRHNLPARTPVGAELVPVLPVRDAVHFPLLVNTLHVIREPSLRAVRKSLEGNRRVLVLSQRDMALEDPKAKDLFEYGTLSEALQAVPMPDSGLRVALRGLQRARASRIVSRSGAFWAEVSPVLEEAEEGARTEALKRACLAAFGDLVHLSRTIPPEALQSVAHIEMAGELADAIAHHLPIGPSQKQELLEEAHAGPRLEKLLRFLKREQQILEFDRQIHSRVESELGDTQREYYLREQLRIIEGELHLREHRIGEQEEFELRIERAKMPQPALNKAREELRRLERSPVSSPEGMVSRNYLECLTDLPWSVLTEDSLDVKAAGAILDGAHFGLDKVKERVLDYLAVRQLTASLRGPILCFTGPPGVGKTSIAKSIAAAMGRRFVRLALGGIRDEAEIRGHRRAYVGAMPGRIIQELRSAGCRNPVFVLDEIDKLGADYRGDPTSALLEALDPEQNNRFSDHYIDSPFDLGAVMFIATANLVENIPPALRDRMEIIGFPNYTDRERKEIARSFLIPKLQQEHGLVADSLRIDEPALDALVTEYTREAGVRALERQIATVCRKSARLLAEGTPKPLEMNLEMLHQTLGRPRHGRNDHHQRGEIGVATGLVVSEHGGDVISIEASLMEPAGASPELRLTGSLGRVMQESAQAAVSYVRASRKLLGADRPFDFDVHIHIPEGGIPKDGPSAGVTIVTALVSAYTGRKIKGGLAMTGEITLRGRVLPVGGVRDKILAAHRIGITELIVPAENLADLDEVPTDVLEQVVIHGVTELSEVLQLALVRRPKV